MTGCCQIVTGQVTGFMYNRDRTTFSVAVNKLLKVSVRKGVDEGMREDEYEGRCVQEGECGRGCVCV